MRRLFLLTLLTCVSGVQAADVSPAEVRAHVEFLASDALNGRGSGTRDEWIAAAYAAAQFTRSGLKPLSAEGFIERVQTERDEVVGEVALNVGTLRLVQGKDMLVRSLGSASISGRMERFEPGRRASPGAVLLMPADLTQLPEEAGAAGLALFRESSFARAHWQELAARTIEVGPVRIIGLKRSQEHDSSRIILSAESYDKLGKLLHAAASLSVQTKSTAGYTWNAAAKLPGSSPGADNEMVLLSAHLDHLGSKDGAGPDRIYHGADDDASGCAAVLALAGALAGGAPLRRTVVFVLFGSEEVGGYGDRYFVERPVLPLNNIIANLEFEMIGRPDPAVPADALWLTGWERSDLGPALRQHGAKLVADPHPEQNFFARSDNIALARRGVVAQTVSSFGLHADYHQPTDEVSRIDFAHMTQAIRSLVEPIRWLAASDFKAAWAPGRQP